MNPDPANLLDMRPGNHRKLYNSKFYLMKINEFIVFSTELIIWIWLKSTHPDSVPKAFFKLIYCVQYVRVLTGINIELNSWKVTGKELCDIRSLQKGIRDDSGWLTSPLQLTCKLLATPFLRFNINTSSLSFR